MIIAVILSLVFIIQSPAVFAAGLEETKSQLNSVQKNIDKTKQQLNTVKSKRKNVIGQLNTIEKNMNVAKTRISVISSNISNTQKNIVQTGKDIEKAKKDLEKQQGVMNKRLVNIYKNGKVSYLEVLIQAASFSDFLNRFDMIREVSKQDVGIFNSMKVKKQAIEKKKAQLESQKKQLEALKLEEKQKQQVYEQNARERSQVLHGLDMQKDDLEAAIDEMEEIAQGLNSTVRSLMKQNGISDTQTDYSGGAMLKPTNGRLSSPYGYRIHPILKTKKFHSGVDLAAPNGTPIKAANDGVVISSGWIKGYGNTIMVDHGGGIVTLYAHASALLCGVGDKVTRGQTIAKVGSTGYSTGPHLHFEVRVNGKTVNPTGYIKI